MPRVPTKLIRSAGGYIHWCPACEMHHILPDRWTFNGDVDRPTFSPSFLQHLGDGRRCHYFITVGEILYCEDSAHALAGTRHPLPDLPP